MSYENLIDTDALNQKIRLLEKERDAEKGKRVAVERRNMELQRENERLEALAQATAEDAGETIQAAAGQLCGVIGFSVFLYAMGQYARAELADMVDAAHVVHREGTLMDALSELITTSEAYMRDPSNAAAKALTDAQNKYRALPQYHHENTETLRAEIARQITRVFRGQAHRVIDALYATIEADTDVEHVAAELNKRGIVARVVNGSLVIE